MAVELYCISEDIALVTMYPCVPELPEIYDILEETTTPRIPLAPTVDKALIASHIDFSTMPREGKLFGVYAPVRDSFLRTDTDSLKRDLLVADTVLSDVVWCRSAIHVTLLCTIRVYPDTNLELLYVPDLRWHQYPISSFLEGRYLVTNLPEWDVVGENMLPVSAYNNYVPCDSVKILNAKVPSMEAIGDSTGGDILKVFGGYFTHLRTDKVLARKILSYVSKFETKNEEHINLLGSNLLGIYKMKYTYDDESEWIDNILEVEDWEELTDDFLDIEEVDRFGIVGKSPVNMSFVYLTHRFMISKDLSTKDKEAVCVAIMKMFHYKFLASLLNHFFPYRTQEAIALNLYESLSKKSLLKKHHSWGGLVRARAEDVVSSGGVHHDTLMGMKDDAKVLYVVTDIQSRIREVIKKLYRDYDALREADARILSESKFIVVDGEHVMREYENNTSALIRNSIEMFKDKHDFIRKELIEQTVILVPTSDERYLLKTLEYISSEFGKKKAPDMEELIRSLIIYIQEYRRTNVADDNNLVEMVIKLRNMYRSSQLTNADIINVRDITGEIVANSISSKHAGIMASTRIACLVYITLRILAYKYFK